MLVVDAAAVVDALTLPPVETVALRTRMTGEELHAPYLIDAEILSVLRGLTLGGHLAAADAQDALTDLDELPIHRWPTGDGLRRRAFQLRHNLSASDAVYVALAEALQCPLLTRDGRIGRATGHAAVVEVV